MQRKAMQHAVVLAAVAAGVAVLASPSLAQTQEERAYVAERDRAAALVKAAPEAERPAAEKRLMPGLEARLRRLIGPGVPKGFNGKSGMIPEWLCCYVDADNLDGIRFTTPDNKGAVLVSTEGLLRLWRSKDNPWDSRGDTTRARAADPARAFLTSEFYTRAGVAPEAAVLVQAHLPIKAPSDAGQAAAVLVQVGQMHDPNLAPPDIAVGLIRNGRVYLALVKATTRPAPVAACGPLLDGFQTKAHTESDPAKAQQLRNEGYLAFEKCWTDGIKGQPGYAAMVRQAQALVDTLAAP